MRIMLQPESVASISANTIACATDDFNHSTIKCHPPARHASRIMNSKQETGPSHLLQVRDHASAHSCVWQATHSRSQVVPEVRDPARARNGAGDCGMRKNVLEEKLRPARAVEFRGPRRQCLPRDPGKEHALGKWTVGD